MKDQETLPEVMPSKETVNQEFSPQSLIALAIEKNVDVGTMERLMAMRRELKEEHAREVFAADMAAFQAAAPIIEKQKAVLNKDKSSVRYKYAPLEEIIEQTRQLRENHGFSFRFDTEVENTPDRKGVKVVCTVKHREGHEEQSRFEVPTDPESYMNAPQKFASAMTYAKRYAFINAFGIITKGEDTDANTAPRTDAKMTKDQQDEIEMLRKQAGVTIAEFAQGIRKHYGISVTQLSKVQADGAIAMLKKKVDANSKQNV